MEVTVHSTLSSAPGQISVQADPDSHVDSLIIAFCVQRGIQVSKPNFTNKCLDPPSHYAVTFWI